MALDKEAILAAEDIRIEEVEVPEWGGSVFVRAMSGKDLADYESSLVEMGANGKVRRMRIEKARVQLVALTVCDETGNRLFTQRDITKLGEKSAAALNRLADAASRLSGISDNDLAELTDDLKNEQSADLPSD